MEKQPDFKKSRQNPYDLNSTPTRDNAPKNPNPYDLDQSSTQANKQEKAKNEK